MGGWGTCTAACRGTLWLCVAERKAVSWCHLCSADGVEPQAKLLQLPATCALLQGVWLVRPEPVSCNTSPAGTLLLSLQLAS